MIKVKRNRLLFVLLPIIILIIVASYFLFPQVFSFKVPPEKVISLTAGDFEHIQFSSKQANVYRYHGNELTIEVDDSASFLMQAFTNVKTIDNISFDWKHEGELAVTDIEHESRRDGDDAYFKLGLLIEAQDSLPDFFLPSWMKRVDKLLNFQSKKIVFLVAGAKHEALQSWQGPYSNRMTMISVSSAPDVEGWNVASYRFSEPVKVVAIWLMADGDDTHSKFTSRVKNIVIDEQDVVDAI